MNNETIVEYVMNTPDNTNPRVLRDMLDQLSSGGGSSDVFVIHTKQDGTTAKTAQEIYNAYEAEKVLLFPGNFYTFIDVYEVEPRVDEFVYRLATEEIYFPQESSGTLALLIRKYFDIPVSEAGEKGFDLFNPTYEWFWDVTVTPNTN